MCHYIISQSPLWSIQSQLLRVICAQSNLIHNTSSPNLMPAVQFNCLGEYNSWYKPLITGHELYPEIVLPVGLEPTTARLPELCFRPHSHNDIHCLHISINILTFIVTTFYNFYLDITFTFL